MNYVLTLVFSYLLGSIPVGYLVARYGKGIDIRRVGSGNIGTTNVIRVLGRFPGTLVFLGDFAKGLLAVLLGFAVGGEPLALLSGLAVVAGHNWSLFLGFKGGRGVATSAGVVLILNCWALLIAGLVWLVTVILSRYVSLGSLLAAISVPAAFLVLRLPLSYFFFGLALAFLIIYGHRPNIARLLKREESRLGKRK